METIDVLYEKSGIAKAFYDQSINAVVVQWENLGPHDQIKACCEPQLKKVEQGAKFVIVDTSNSTGILRQEDQDWLGEVLFTGYEKAGIKAVITVLSQKSALTKLTSKRWVKTGSPFKFDMLEVGSMNDAKEYIKTNA